MTSKTGSIRIWTAMLSLVLVASCERTETAAASHEVATGSSGRVQCRIDRGRVACRGPNDWGTLGDGGVRDRATDYLEIPGPTDVRAVVVSSPETFVCALGGTIVWCWGDGHDLGVAVGSPGARLVEPRPVGGLPAIERLSAGFAHACALGVAGHGYCWGDNQIGPIAEVRPHAPRLMPATRVFDGELVELVAGVLQTCGLTAAGDVVCRGGAIPQGDQLVPAYAATQVVGGAVRVYQTRAFEMCARLRGGGERCWMPVTRESAGAHERRRESP